jgi:hypothetical protein
VKQEKLGEANFIESKFASISRKISCKEGRVRPKASKGINTTPWVPKRGFIHHLLPQDREEGDWIDKGALISLHLL